VGYGMGLIENEVLAYLKKFDDYTFDVELDKKTSKIGNGESNLKLVFYDTPDVYDMLDSTTMSLGEAYVSGNLKVEGYNNEQYELLKAAEIFFRQYDKFAFKKRKFNKELSKVRTLWGERRELTKHYGLEKDFYKLLFGESMLYSAACFENGIETLEEAQNYKIASLIEKMQLQGGMTICDIGCGYGNLVIEMAERYDIKAVMITLNKKEKEYMDKVILEKELEDSLEVKCMSWEKFLKLPGKFDRIICMNMLNHVKPRKFKNFFSKFKSKLNEDGRMYMEVIHNPHGYIADPWVSKYVFKGVSYPKITYILKKAAKSGFQIESVKSIRKNYYLTYLNWYKNFINNRDDLEEKYKIKDIRIWELYLCAYAVAFEVCFLDASIVIFK